MAVLKGRHDPRVRGVFAIKGKYCRQPAAEKGLDCPEIPSRQDAAPTVGGDCSLEDGNPYIRHPGGSRDPV
jgi:hypothetical protein